MASLIGARALLACTLAVAAVALLGKIGRGAGAFLIGDQEGPVRMRESGRLFLGINDDSTTFSTTGARSG